MLQQFYPDHEADSAYGIDYKTLYLSLIHI